MSSTDPSTPIDVDLTRSTNGVWLVKMPKYLSQILEEFGDGAINEVGRLIRRPPANTAKGPNNPALGARSQEVFFTLNDQIIDQLREKNPSKDYKPPPREHQFCLSNVSDGVLRTIYTRTTGTSNAPSNEEISLVGKVMQRAEVRPVGNDEYMALKRKQFEISQVPTRKAQMITKKASNIYLPRRDHEANKIRMKAKQQAGKRVRSDEDVVLNKLFDAFAKHQFISMGSLESITQQPKNYLQELVKRYCNYNNSTHTYELKPQFRHYGSTNEGDDDEDDDDDEDNDDFKDDDEDNNNPNA